MNVEVRLQKFLAEAGIASRRKSEEIILAGEISVNGNVVRELGVKINDKTDVVLYKGERVQPQSRKVYIMLHKPEGFVTTVKDQFGRASVVDLVKDIDERIFPVGRL
ncbi:MAG: rRNA pseudouridine synthase, partial [Firmicutes bacterium]|nr:rRNA pseudouridine synthase [Bacillota bacterium]